VHPKFSPGCLASPRDSGKRAKPAVAVLIGAQHARSCAMTYFEFRRTQKKHSKKNNTKKE